MTEEPIAIQTVAPIEKPGTKYVYISTQKCPHCDNLWSYEMVAARGEIDLEKHRGEKLGMALLCGICEAKRRCYHFYREKGAWIGKATIRRFWDDEADNKEVFRRIYQWPHDFQPRIDRREEWNGRDLLDEKTMELERIMRFRGRWVPMLPQSELKRLGLDWKVVDA
jgi:hypothetical protein